MRALGVFLACVLLGCGPEQVGERTPPSAAPGGSERPERACERLPESTRLYALGSTENGLTSVTQLRGDPGVVPVLELREVRVNDDDEVDYHAGVAEEAMDGERPPVIRNEYGESMTGLYVGCAEGIAEVVPPDMHLTLELLDDEQVVGGVRWRDVLIHARGESVYDEEEDLESGRVPERGALLRMREGRGYAADDSARAEHAATCRAHANAEQWEQARTACHVAAVLSQLTADAVELLTFLARAEDAVGNAEAARRAYGRAIEYTTDPEDRARLESLRAALR